MSVTLRGCFLVFSGVMLRFKKKSITFRVHNRFPDALLTLHTFGNRNIWGLFCFFFLRFLFTFYVSSFLVLDSRTEKKGKTMNEEEDGFSFLLYLCWWSTFSALVLSVRATFSTLV